MKNMSFMLTRQQVLDHSKTVTRRMGWKRLLPDCQIQPVAKGMGLKLGEKIERIGLPVLIVCVEFEPLCRMTDDPEYGKAECIKEGFPDLTPSEFIDMFCNSHKGCLPGTEVTRIEFKYLECGA